MVELNVLESIKEMGDRSASLVMESLSGMLGMEVVMDVSTVSVEAIERIPSDIGLSDEHVVGAYAGFSGEVSGSVLTVLSIESARKLADILLAGMDDEEPLEYLTEMQESAILEVGNILTSPFIDVWADTVSIELTQSPPSIACDLLHSVIDRSLDGRAETNIAIAFNSALHVVDQDIDCNILLLPDPDKMEMLFNRL